MSYHIANDLIEAYEGIYEDRLAEMPAGEREEWIKEKIIGHSNKERLETYLSWNGILGFANRIYEISTGEMFVVHRGF